MHFEDKYVKKHLVHVAVDEADWSISTICILLHIKLLCMTHYS